MNAILSMPFLAFFAVSYLTQCDTGTRSGVTSDRAVRQVEVAAFAAKLLLVSKKPKDPEAEEHSEHSKAHKEACLGILNEQWQKYGFQYRLAKDDECLIIGEVSNDGEYIMRITYMGIFGEDQDAVVARLPYGATHNVEIRNNRLEVPFDRSRAFVFRKAPNSNIWISIEDSPKILWREPQ